MYTEIERKFLVTDESWKKEAVGIAYCQGYIYSTPQCLVRIRLEGNTAYLTIKGPKHGIARMEFEYTIPTKDAEELLQDMAFKPLIYKKRYKIPLDNHIWEIDVFEGDNTGLIVAEIELQTENATFTQPPWLGKEVTHDPRYRNAALARHPFSQWTMAEKAAYNAE